MEWTRADDESFAEMMEEYALVEPVIERIFFQDAAMDQVTHRLNRLEAWARKQKEKPNV